MIVAALFAAGMASAAAVSASTTTVKQPCLVTGSGPAVRCIVMPDTTAKRVILQLQDGRGTGAVTDFLITDNAGAPKLWNNTPGLYAGGDGDNTLGGQICVTYRLAYCAVALTPRGTLILTPTGASGQTGQAVEVTADEMIRLLALIGVTPAHPKTTVVAP